MAKRGLIATFMCAAICISGAEFASAQAKDGVCSNPQLDSSVLNASTLRLSYGNSYGVSNNLENLMKTSLDDAANRAQSKLNASSCNQGGDDFPWLGYFSGPSFKGFNAAGSVFGVRIYYYPNSNGPVSCAHFIPDDPVFPKSMRNTIEVFGNFLATSCPLGDLADWFIFGGTNAELFAIEAEISRQLQHEALHPMGMKESSDPDCAIGPMQLVNNGTEWVMPSDISGAECSVLDAGSNSDDELRDECNTHPDCDVNPPGGIDTGPGNQEGIVPEGPGGWPGWGGNSGPPSIDDFGGTLINLPGLTPNATIGGTLSFCMETDDGDTICWVWPI